MKPKTATKSKKASSGEENVFELIDPEEACRAAESDVHVYGNSQVCETDKRGYPTPHNKSTAEIRVDSSEGFIPLWGRGLNLRWRFNERSMRVFRQPEFVKARIRELIGEAIAAWDDAAPIRFSERADAVDFELTMRGADDCNARGACVLASAFFPDAGRHRMWMYPRMFDQSRKEQVDTFIHEIGHVYGLRHFFANVRETGSPSELFGKDRKFSIMNYGPNSELTADDKVDLKRLYEEAWSGVRSAVNGTPIRFFRPFHYQSLSSFQVGCPMAS